MPIIEAVAIEVMGIAYTRAPPAAIDGAATPMIPEIVTRLATMIETAIMTESVPMVEMVRTVTKAFVAIITG